MRRLTTFECAGETLAGTLDAATGETGLLIVTGGTQVRVGAHRGLVRLAAAVAAAGFPVFRFERRGVGDSGGSDPGFAGSGPDIAAAVMAFRHECPHVTRIIGFGLCDGATAVALHHAAAGIAALILANPWLIEPVADLPPPAAIRRRYLDRLASPSAWARLLTGGIDYRKALRGLRAIGRSAPTPAIGGQMASALHHGGVPVDIILANRDATAIAFANEWRTPCFAAVRATDKVRLKEIETPAHSFAPVADAEKLAALCIAALRRMMG